MGDQALAIRAGMTASIGEQIHAAARLLARGDLSAARRLVDKLKRQADAVGDVWALDGELCIRERRLTDALKAVDRALELEPELAERHVQRARCYLLGGLEDEARASALQAIAFDIPRLDYLLVLGGVLVRCGEHQHALTVFQRALAMDDQNAEVFRGLASVYRFLGDLRLAEQSADEAIRLEPHDYETIGLRSSLRTQTADSNHVQELEDRLSSGVRHWRGAVHVGYALAKEYEDLGLFDRVFPVLTEAARVKRQHTRYDLHDDLKIFPALEQAFSVDALRSSRGQGCLSDAPIFVLGMPRTGSTLVERIISSHSAVENIGEASAFPAQMVRLATEYNGGRPVDRLILPEAALAIPPAVMGEAYLAAVAGQRQGAGRFVDKLPQNSLNIGLITRALPQAKMVHVAREPMDACYAMFKYLFKNGYPWSYDLEELASYYAAYYRLMELWKELVPAEQLYEIRYEELVANLEAESRKLLAWLGLPWEDACLEFHRNREASTTGSASQVRRTVYRSSVGKWRHYARHLDPLRERLIALGVPVE